MNTADTEKARELLIAIGHCGWIESNKTGSRVGEYMINAEHVATVAAALASARAAEREASAGVAANVAHQIDMRRYRLVKQTTIHIVCRAIRERSP